MKRKKRKREIRKEEGRFWQKRANAPLREIDTFRSRQGAPRLSSRKISSNRRRKLDLDGKQGELVIIHNAGDSVNTQDKGNDKPGCWPELVVSFVLGFLSVLPFLASPPRVPAECLAVFHVGKYVLEGDSFFWGGYIFFPFEPAILQP